MAIDAADGEECLLDGLRLCHELLKSILKVTLLAILHGDILEKRDRKHIVAEQSR